MIMNKITTDSFKHYDSPKQYAEAFQQMIDARERWRKQIREQKLSNGDALYMRPYRQSASCL